MRLQRLVREASSQDLLEAWVTALKAGDRLQARTYQTEIVRRLLCGI